MVPPSTPGIRYVSLGIKPQHHGMMVGQIKREYNDLPSILEHSAMDRSECIMLR